MERRSRSFFARVSRPGVHAMIGSRKSIKRTAASIAFLSLASPLFSAQPAEGPSSAAANAEFVPTVFARDICRFMRPEASEGTRWAYSAIEERQPASDDEFGLGPPTPNQLFRVESEEGFRNRIKEGLPQVKNVQFPLDVPPSGQTRSSGAFFPARVAPVSAVICYRPLYFEDWRTERYGEYVPCLQPLISASKFYYGVLNLPGRVIASPPWSYTCDNP